MADTDRRWVWRLGLLLALFVAGCGDDRRPPPTGIQRPDETAQAETRSAHTPAPVATPQVGAPPKATVSISRFPAITNRLPGTDIDVVPIPAKVTQSAGGASSVNRFAEAGATPRPWRVTESGMELLGEDGTVLRVIDGAKHVFTAPAGGAIVYARDHRGPWTLETADGRRHAIPEGADPSFAPDGSALAYYTAVTASRVVEAHHVDLQTLTDRTILTGIRQCDPYCEGRPGPSWTVRGELILREHQAPSALSTDPAPRQWKYDARAETLQEMPGTAARTATAADESFAPPGERWHITDPEMEADATMREVKESGVSCRGIRFFYREGGRALNRCVPLPAVSCDNGNEISGFGTYISKQLPVPSAYSPDSTRVFAAARCETVAIDLVTGTVRALPGSEWAYAQWSPDSRYLLTEAVLPGRRIAVPYVYDARQDTVFELQPEQGGQVFVFGTRTLPAFWLGPNRIALATVHSVSARTERRGREAVTSTE